jgi:5-methylcytosine-specific restriction endonuclease McrA
MKTKKCVGLLCNGKRQKISLFNKDAGRKDSLQLVCRSCNKEYRIRNDKKIKKTAKKYRENNKEKVAKDKKLYAKKNKKKLQKYKHSYYLKHKTELYQKAKKRLKGKKKESALYMKKYRKKHKKKMKIQHDKWYKKNIKKAKAIRKKSARTRRAKKLKLNETYTTQDEQITLKKFKNKCAKCGTNRKLEIDHHRPLSKGNPLTLSNAVVLCRACNASKSDKDPEEFYGTRRCKQIDKKLKNIFSKL